jgi:hypothetical protein
LVCLIELLTVNAFIMSTLCYQQIFQYFSKLNQKAIYVASKMPSNVSKIYDNNKATKAWFQNIPTRTKFPYIIGS